MEVFSVKNLSFSYPNSNFNALENISFSLSSGEFIVISGESGSGKSTLLKLLKKEIAPKGNINGSIDFLGENLLDIEDKVSAEKIGYLSQNPELQIVNNIVINELVFSLNNLGYPKGDIANKLAEITHFFGIEKLLYRKTDELSGGEKQLVNLASILMSEPRVLLLDEPTTWLDPIATQNFINILEKVNKEFGIAILIVEHNIDDLLSICDKFLYLEKGKICVFDTPKIAVKRLQKLENYDKISLALPLVAQLYTSIGDNDNIPFNVRDCKAYIERKFDNKFDHYKIKKSQESSNVISLKKVYFRYSKNDNDIIKDCSIDIKEGMITCILGGNGAGKTTLIKLICGLLKAYSGSIKIIDKKIEKYKGNSLYRGLITMLPQNPLSLFVKSTGLKDILEYAKILDIEESVAKEKLYNFAEKLGVKNILEKNVLDLSGGELQRLAICKLLMQDARIILFDEPTKAIDNYAKKQFAEILELLKAEGKTIIIVSHDIEFCAMYSDMCAMLFDGRIITYENPLEFFSKNRYYTTVASRVSRGIYKNAVTMPLLLELCKKNGVKNEAE